MLSCAVSCAILTILYCVLLCAANPGAGRRHGLLYYSFRRTVRFITVSRSKPLLVRKRELGLDLDSESLPLLEVFPYPAGGCTTICALFCPVPVLYVLSESRIR